MARRTLSVALCTYQGAAHLGEQLASLAAQTRRPDEVVVGDDGSTDDTVDLLEHFAEGAAFPLRVVHHQRLGASANFAATIAHCRGDLIALCDQDDRWHPERLAVGEAALEAASEAHLAFSNAALVDDAGDALDRTLWGSLGVGRATMAALRADPLATLLRRPVITGCTVTFRRSLLEVAHPFPFGGGLQHDRWLALCAASLGPLVAIEDTLVDYRIHLEQHTGLGPLSTASGRPRGRLHPSRWRNLRRLDDGRLGPAIDQIESLAARLDARGLVGGRDVLDACRSLVVHRADLPARRARRVVPVARHLARGDYRRFSTGWVGAVADLLRR